ncbi:hypothetical protein [Paraburkholderia hospita]|uniref:hypothetical protein n=1 Tax=Paraburkholderia hospita TaxID=169430 RepID=UPI000B6A14A4|nr:hypothetical protein [Paraburkholderia hospita]OUL82261.1 hypothetical protein CA601_29410 [Paraburkholderia hospita]
MRSVTRYASAVLATTALMFGASACKKVDEKSSDTMSSASSSVMTNTAGVSGAPGQSAAAKSASENAAGATAPPSSREAPAVATPSSMASAVPSGASQ